MQRAAFLVLATLAACAQGPTDPSISDAPSASSPRFDVSASSVAAAAAVAIDIQPGKSPNALSARRPAETVPVLVLSTATFDATELDVASLTLGDERGSDTPVARSKSGTLLATPPFDMNGDGRRDLLVHFRTSDLVANGDVALTAGRSFTLALRGARADGTAVRGTDALGVTP